MDLLDRHIEDLVQGRDMEMMEINEIVTNTLGHHPCHFYDDKIIGKAKYLLTETDLSIAEIAYFFIQEAGRQLNDYGRICTIVTSLLAAYTGLYSTYEGMKAPVEIEVSNVR